MSFTALSVEETNRISSLEILHSELDLIKGLVENSYDAKAKKIEIFILDFNVIVKDDGDGIASRDRTNVELFYHTSKM